ncbi:MAG TPA: sulfite exporter TauE/SafE family protein [Chitinophagaceae bacterium]|nr:sulfite exporter TauE/SafE family protein [Chitinophagaceae bacterium]
MHHPEIGLFFLLVAFIYAAVGFGGGSSYLAILALYALPFREMRLIALVCNIIVVTGSCIIFIRNKQVDLKKILPMVLVSVPMAFAGAVFRINQTTFFILLGISLVMAAVLLWITAKPGKETTVAAGGRGSVIKNSLLGGAIGFLSGMVGIGGGIFLSPVLNLMNWDTPKKIAATASIFILLNSLSGIAGQLYNLPAEINWLQVVVLALAVFIGGQLGARLGAVKLDQLLVRRITAAVVFFAGMEILFKHFS